MSPLFLMAGGARLLAPVLSSSEVDTGLNVLNVVSGVGLAAFLLRSLITRSLRTAGEVQEANAREAAALARAEAAEAKLAKLQETVMSDLSPALLKNSVQGERLVEATTKIAEWVEKLINSFLQRIERIDREK